MAEIAETYKNFMFFFLSLNILIKHSKLFSVNGSPKRAALPRSGVRNGLDSALIYTPVSQGLSVAKHTFSNQLECSQVIMLLSFSHHLVSFV